ncbi:MAG: hypothetical protein LBP83_06785 [Dysgonamonadaceae bacterium]|jgi:hypothetical protein|nr:hypothetical protein [Dysgonamonadaceae bacterium]
MKKLVDLVKLDRLDNLIRREATGTPDELAEKLRMSRSNLFEFISFLKYEMSAPIFYNKVKASYIYTYVPKFYLGFEMNKLQKTEMYAIISSIGEEKVIDNKGKDTKNFVFDDNTLFNGFFPEDLY